MGAITVAKVDHKKGIVEFDTDESMSAAFIITKAGKVECVSRTDWASEGRTYFSPAYYRAMVRQTYAILTPKQAAKSAPQREQEQLELIAI